MHCPPCLCVLRGNCCSALASPRKRCTNGSSLERTRASKFQPGIAETRSALDRNSTLQPRIFWSTDRHRVGLTCPPLSGIGETDASPGCGSPVKVRQTPFGFGTLP